MKDRIEIEELSRLHVEDGDVLIFRTPQLLSPSDMKSTSNFIRQKIQQDLAKNICVLVIPGGSSWEVNQLSEDLITQLKEKINVKTNA